eukprot:TRINITY_DN36235_c0_g1_i1.p1 TRINITY_DN36235_c0_g1~~TRINITY_DN36235_c0_g1_i1.p1  ORF type:complete len:253 (-),score=42.25 TRINITY_DN36235_c0_g1_i1:761-1519(-)
MMCVFGNPQQLQVGSPSKIRIRENGCSIRPEEEEFLYGYFEMFYNWLPRRQHAYVNEHLMGGGANGIVYLEGPRCSLANNKDGSITVFFKGEITDDFEQETDADYLCSKYEKLFEDEPIELEGDIQISLEKKLQELTKLHGDFAFVIFDRNQHIGMVCRDYSGGEHLFWGEMQMGEGLLLADDPAILEGECTDVDSFPPASLMLFRPGETQGVMFALQQPQQQSVPCRASNPNEASEGQIEKVPSLNQIESI